MADDRAFILRQLDGQWQKIPQALLFKFSRDTAVVITQDDLQALAEYLADGEKRLLTWGHWDSIELRLVKREEAERLVKHVEGLSGGAPS